MESRCQLGGGGGVIVWSLARGLKQVRGVERGDMRLKPTLRKNLYIVKFTLLGYSSVNLDNLEFRVM